MHTYIHTYIHTYVHTYIHTCIHTIANGDGISFNIFTNEMQNKTI